MFYRVDPLSAFFLICFGIGLVTSLGSLLLGAHGDIGSHDGNFHGAAGHGDLTHGAADLGDLTHSAPDVGAVFHATFQGGDIGHVAYSHVQGSEPVSFLNLNTLLGFLLGFGATGFVLKEARAGLPLILILLFALLGGALFAFILYLVLAKILVRGQTAYLKASDFNLVGVEGSVSSTIFSDRVGEVSYILNRSLAALPAKEKDGREIKKGEPVIIVEVKDGIAIVLSKKEFMNYTKN